MAFGIDDAIAAGLKIINKFVPDPKEKIEAEKALRESLQAWDKMQTEVNVEEAKHASIFVSGARPFIMWVCGSALAIQFVIGPLGVWVCGLFGHTLPLPPSLDNMLWELMSGMLGLSGMRTFEKIKGVARK